MEKLLAGLRAAGEATRLRLLAVLAESDLTVSELTQILGQSQPRISRHLKLMVEGGLLERHREGAWVFYRLSEAGGVGSLARTIVKLIPPGDPDVLRDRERLDAVRSARRAQANSYFAKVAPRWNALRSRHVSEALVESALLDLLIGAPRARTFRDVVDLGTGTARMLEILAPYAASGLGIDMNHDMLQIARANLEAKGLRNMRVRHGDIYHLNLPDQSADLVIIHQVLHFLDEPQSALREAARLLRPGGELAVIDFAPHEFEEMRNVHAHRRLGFAAEEVAKWCEAAGLQIGSVRHLAPESARSDQLTVTVWLARAGSEKKPARIRHKALANV